MDTVEVVDKQNGGKVYPMNFKRAYALTVKYPSRFEFKNYQPEARAVGPLALPASQTKESEKNMPQGIPKGFTPPADGLHDLLVMGTETKFNDAYKKNQEEVTCEVDGDPEKSVRIYFPHDGKKWFTQGVDAGIIDVDEMTEEWNVIPGRKCKALWQNGKLVQLFKM